MWRLYKIVLQLRSPLHVGYIKIGNLMRTRPYVPGKTIWGAVTAALALERFGGDFQKAQEQTKSILAFSYFYPALEIDSPLWPHYTEDGLCYGNQRMSAVEFERRFLAAYSSTALDYSCNAAATESLHEVEFISPRDRCEGRPVYLVGYIFEHQNSLLDRWDGLHRIRLGGERKSGWGQVSCHDVQRCSELLFDLPVRLTTERPSVYIRAKEPIRAHVPADAIYAVGLIEPLVGRETRQAAHCGGVFPERVSICWAPGSCVMSEGVFQIDHDGVWRPS